MKQSWFGRPERDPKLRDALRRLEAAPPPVNEDALRARISLAAQPALRALRGQADPRSAFRPWWVWTAGWARLTVPAGAGVALASALLLVRAGAPVLQAVAADTVAVSSILVSAGADAAGTQMLDRLLAPANQDWLFTEAMARP